MTVDPLPPLCPAPGATELPVPPAPLFGQLLMTLSRHWRRLLELRLAEQGLTDATWVPLVHLYTAQQPLTLKTLAHRVGLESSTLVRVVDLLEGRGLLQRTTDAQDRRSKQLCLTAQGRTAVADVRRTLQQVEARLLEGLDATTVQLLHSGMQQLSDRLGQALDAAPAPQEGQA